MIRNIARMAKDLQFRDDIDTAFRGISSKAQNIIRRKSLPPRQLFITRYRNRQPVVIGKMQKQGIHLPIGHEIDKSVIIILFFQKARGIDHQAVDKCRIPFRAGKQQE